MGGAKDHKNGVNVDGDWLPIPLRFLQSRACAELSPHALKLLVDLMALLKPNGGKNGDIWVDPDYLRARGWVSDATRQGAMRELRAHELVRITRRRRGRTCELIALTLWPLACDRKKLDSAYDKSPHTTRDYRRSGDSMFPPPTASAPAEWRKVRPKHRETVIVRSPCGLDDGLSGPLRAPEAAVCAGIEPAAGVIPA